MALAKKKRARGIEITAIAQAGASVQSPSTTIQPALASTGLNGSLTKAAYGLTGLILLVFLLFLLNGYRLQPFVIVDNFLPQMMNQTPGSPQEILPLYDDQVWQVKLNEDGIPVLSTIVDKDRPAGFIIPKTRFPLERIPREVSLSIQSVYKGMPIFRYGFQRYDSIKDTADLTKKSVNLEYPAMMENFQPVWSPPIYYSTERFAFPIQDADFLFVIINSDRRTELHIGRLTLIGKP